jgi:hypothetical protein
VFGRLYLSYFLGLLGGARPTQQMHFSIFFFKKKDLLVARPCGQQPPPHAPCAAHNSKKEKRKKGGGKKLAIRGIRAPTRNWGAAHTLR